MTGSVVLVATSLVGSRGGCGGFAGAVRCRAACTGLRVGFGFALAACLPSGASTLTGGSVRSGAGVVVCACPDETKPVVAITPSEAPRKSVHARRTTQAM